ncbi:MAG: FGGY family carbohydrate kinase [Coriobacteriales bacterium]|jgi:conserved hypothetical sugar kinase|nr:MAG: hypothetical protein DBY05_12340 [Clostridiales bacterium]
MKNLLIDIGSTSVKWAETSERENIVKVRKIPFPPKLCGKPSPFYEVSREAIISGVKEIVRASSARNVYISTQMHGWLLGDGCGNALTEYVSWRDKRGGLRPYAFSLAPEHGVGLKPNLPRASVRVTEELYPEIKEKAKVFFTLGSYVAFRLTGRNATHITDAAASGFFNAVTARPDSCGLKLPEAVLDVEQIGTYEGKRIFSPVGDQQAAILGSGAKRGTYILNLGTAAQMCAINPSFITGNFESRPYFNGETLCTVTNLGGGGYISEHASDEGLAERLSEEYLEAISRLPRRDCLTATGGTLSYYGELLAKVFAAMKIKTAVCEKADALEGLKKISEGNCL